VKLLAIQTEPCLPKIHNLLTTPFQG